MIESPYTPLIIFAIDLDRHTSYFSFTCAVCKLSNILFFSSGYLGYLLTTLLSSMLYRNDPPIVYPFRSCKFTLMNTILSSTQLRTTRKPCIVSHRVTRTGESKPHGIMRQSRRPWNDECKNPVPSMVINTTQPPSGITLAGVTHSLQPQHTPAQS